MTFIASVIAKNGVAVIADSLVTTKKRVMEESTYYEYLKKKKDPQSGNYIIDPVEISSLFKQTTSHTKDYEEKLFQFDKWTAITTAGSAYINDKRIQKVVENILHKLKENKKSFSGKNIQTKIKEFVSKLEIEVNAHINKYEYILPTDFIITHYDHKNEKSIINRVVINYSDKDSLAKHDYELISNTIANEQERVVFGGQDRITERILFGNFFTIASALPILLDCIVDELQIERNKIPQDIVTKIMKSKNAKFQQVLFEGIKIAQLNELSLQEAVELANLLMRIEMDFQKYTETIPTVGGVIKIAIINKEGFHFLTGDTITPPQHI